MTDSNHKLSTNNFEMIVNLHSETDTLIIAEKN